MSRYNNAINQYGGKDFYKILRINHTATEKDIKVSYKAIAMELHPDMHQGCPKKVEQFKEINEAYAILKDLQKRKEYDAAYGMGRYGTGTTTNSINKDKPHGWYNKNRKSPLPKDYRKVYAPRPPPDWDTLWDHELHHEMHYGHGFRKRAMQDAINEARANGEFVYRSPIGRGFTFASIEDHHRVNNNDSDNSNTNTNSTKRTSNTKRDESTTKSSSSSGSTGSSSAKTHTTTSNTSSSSSFRHNTGRRKHKHQQRLYDENGFPLNVNPFSKKAHQGPESITIEYEEWEMSDQTRGDMKMNNRYTDIVNELHTARKYRRQTEEVAAKMQQQYRHRQRSYEEHKRQQRQNQQQKQQQQDDTGQCVIL